MGKAMRGEKSSCRPNQPTTRRSNRINTKQATIPPAPHATSRKASGPCHDATRSTRKNTPAMAATATLKRPGRLEPGCNSVDGYIFRGKRVHKTKPGKSEMMQKRTANQHP